MEEIVEPEIRVESFGPAALSLKLHRHRPPRVHAQPATKKLTEGWDVCLLITFL